MLHNLEIFRGACPTVSPESTFYDHTAVRNSVVELISCNKQVFTAYFMPAVADTIIEHTWKLCLNQAPGQLSWK